MEKQKIIDFLKSLCPTGKIEFNNLDKTLTFEQALTFEGNVYFLGSVENKDKRNKDKDIIFKNYFFADFDIRENFKKVNGKIIDDIELSFYLDFIKKGLQDNGYGDYRYIINTGNGFHFYWVGEGQNFDAEQYRDAIEYYYQEIDEIFKDKILRIDHACKNIGRIARLPGSKNYGRNTKYGLKIQEVEILEDTGMSSDKIKNIPQTVELAKQKNITDEIEKTIKDITDPELEAILEMDIVPFVEEYTGLKLGKDKKNFPDKDGNTGMFVADNILFWIGTPRISSKHNGYNTFTFIKEHYNLDNHGVFERFRERYPDIKNKPKEIKQPDEIIVDFEHKVPYTWGLDCLDRRFGKYDINKFNVIVGESQSGKTEYTFFQARENAKNHKTVYISLEMTPRDMIIRYAMKKAGVSQAEWSNKTITENQKDIMKYQINRIQKIDKLKIIGLENPNINSLIQLIKEYYVKGYQLFYIDNLGFILGDGQEIDYTKNISREMKSLTNVIPITINLVHHFNKGNTKEREKGRGLADMRSSGKIENDADNVLKVERDLSTDCIDEEMRAEVRIALMKDRVYGQPSGTTIYFKKGEYTETF